MSSGSFAGGIKNEQTLSYPELKSESRMYMGLPDVDAVHF